MASAWIGPAISAASASLTRRCRPRSRRPSNRRDAMTSLKCDSEPGGTSCMWLSLSTSRCTGSKAASSLVRISASTLMRTNSWIDPRRTGACTPWRRAPAPDPYPPILSLPREHRLLEVGHPGRPVHEQPLPRLVDDGCGGGEDSPPSSPTESTGRSLSGMAVVAARSGRAAGRAGRGERGRPRCGRGRARGGAGPSTPPGRSRNPSGSRSRRGSRARPPRARRGPPPRGARAGRCPAAIRPRPSGRPESPTDRCGAAAPKRAGSARNRPRRHRRRR